MSPRRGGNRAPAVETVKIRESDHARFDIADRGTKFHNCCHSVGRSVAQEFKCSGRTKAPGVKRALCQVIVINSETAVRKRPLRQPWLPPLPTPEPRSQFQKLHLVCATFFITTPVVHTAIRQLTGTLTLTNLVSNKLTNLTANSLLARIEAGEVIFLGE